MKISPSVVIEYNGMWKVGDFEALNLPQMEIEQSDNSGCQHIQMYLNNLKPLFVEMVQGRTGAVNRCTDIELWQDTESVWESSQPTQAEVILKMKTLRSRIFSGMICRMI